MQVICKKNNLIYDNQPHYFASITIGKSYELLNISSNLTVIGESFYVKYIDPFRAVPVNSTDDVAKINTPLCDTVNTG